jgi:hypothetical protein
MRAGHPAVAEPRRPGGLEVKNEHFTLWTDASAERGREISRAVECQRAPDGT